MKLLVIGAGGREHALAWRLAQSPRVLKVYVAPGNAGTGAEPDIENLPLTDFGALATFVRQEKIAFTVVGPEAPLAAGIVDVFRDAGLPVVGPTLAAARLESSKEYAKAFMQRHGIPTASHRAFIEAHAARSYVRERGAPIVIKADGLAAGKGVVVADTLEDALKAIDQMLAAGERPTGPPASIIIEDYIQGEEASFIALSDGRHILPLATSQDHKRLLDADQGPNTGGMGAYSPAPIITPALHNRIMREIMLPAVRGMAQDGAPYTGFLYAGLMIGPGKDTERDLRVLEFNCRLGDPEAQVIMMRIKNDFPEILEHALDGTLNQADIEWDRRAALGVVLASSGYPDAPRSGDPISSLAPDTPERKTFHAGTVVTNGELHTAGGRVICVTVLADSIRRAQQAAYEAVDQTQFPGRQYRRDIGWRALNKGR